MYKKVIQKGLIILLIILLGLLIYLIKLSYKENELISTGSTTTKIDTTSSTTTTVTTTTTSTTTTTTKAIELSDSIYAPYHIENYDNYSIDNIIDIASYVLRSITPRKYIYINKAQRSLD